MCFSVKANFLSAGVIGTIGVATLKKAKRSQLLLATLPLLFAIQQFSEGLVWLSSPDSLTGKISSYVFLLFAIVIWPTYFFLKTYGSVWCFFAAALSVIIYLHVRSKSKS